MKHISLPFSAALCNLNLVKEKLFFVGLICDKLVLYLKFESPKDIIVRENGTYAVLPVSSVAFTSIPFFSRTPTTFSEPMFGMKNSEFVFLNICRIVPLMTAKWRDVRRCESVALTFTPSLINFSVITTLSVEKEIGERYVILNYISHRID